MAIRMGPILGFRGCQNNSWRISVLVAADRKDGQLTLSLQANGATTSPAAKLLKSIKSGTTDVDVWRFDCEVAQKTTTIQAKYSVGSAAGSFSVPPSGSMPRIAYASCNGFSSLKLLKHTKDPNVLWRDLNRLHQAQPFHLMLLGGDQLYSDSMWEELKILKQWATLPMDKRVKRSATQPMLDKLDEFFRLLYLNRWSQPEPAAVLANIPSLMMWDDHDIMDGWGSYPEKLQNCDVYKAIFNSAREYFVLYQQQTKPGERHPLALPGQELFTCGCQIGPLAILALDMRSERSNVQVISPESWKVAYDWMQKIPAADKPGGVKHLFIMSSIPVVHPDFAMLEQALGVFPGQQELEDDLLDHWTSVPHRQERLRFIHRMLALSKEKNCRVTLLSGDVHVGAVGVIRSERAGGGDPAVNVINQLTSSGIVHPAPPGMALFFLEHVVGKDMSDDRDVASEITEIPGTRHHFIGARNWLALEPDGDQRYWANWHVENEDHPFTKVIHPVNYKMGEAQIPT